MTDACSSHGFNVIRVAAAPFWPVDAKLLTDDEQQASRFLFCFFGVLICIEAIAQAFLCAVLGANGRVHLGRISV
jgi:hypothetical protein